MRNIEELSFRVFCMEQYLPFVRTRKRSWRIDKSIVNNHLLPFFGEVPMADVNASNLLMFQNKKLQEGYQPSSINRMTVLFKYIVNSAMRWGIRPREVGWAADAPELRNIRSRERFLSPIEAQQLIRVLKDFEHRLSALFFEALLFTGARKSELLTAQWHYLDWSSQTVMVPLSKSGTTRYIYVSDYAIELFKSALECSGSKFIFSEPGQNSPIANVSRQWEKIKRRACLQDLRLHDLRHSYASFLISQGRSLFEVQKLLGHANAKTTMRYAHLANRQLISAVNTLPVSIDPTGMLHASSDRTDQIVPLS